MDEALLRTLTPTVIGILAAGTTQESFVRMTELLTDNIRRAVTGQPVRNLVNSVDPVVRRR